MGSKKRWDGVRLINPDGYHNILPYIMPKRTEAEVSSTESFDITELCDYMKERNEAEGTNLKLFHAFCTAVARTIYHRPKLNIFISGRRFWQRSDITMAFVVKQKFEDNADETLMFMKVKPEMTLDDVSHLILGDIAKVRKAKSNDLDKLMNFVGSLPRWFLEIFFWILGRMEYHGVYPKSLAAGDPNYATVMLSNLGSIKAGSPYHHLNNYGTLSIMITIGTMHKEMRRMPDGTEQERTMLEATFTLDERIADGFYFAKSIRIARYLLEHPKALEESIETPVPVDVN